MTTHWSLVFESAILIENRPLLTLYQKLLAIFSYILKEKYISELRRWIVNLSEIRLNVTDYLHNLHANTCHFAKRYYQVTLFCIIRVTSRNTISVDVPSPPFHLGGGGSTTTHGLVTWAGTDCRVQRSLLILNTSHYRTCRLRKKSTTPFQSFTIRLLEVSVNSNLFHLYFTSINIYPDESNFTEVTN